ncbi:MAG: hypothetical protein LBQ11_02035 [Candidatus Nomurabacteria bacterium]|jgi:hypothetical protein|nr:hypothetical protein [Candidatus Nomurabacteria bacterium]
MKKRRLLFLIVNLVAIFLAVISVFLPWWQGLRPSDVSLTEILPFNFLNGFGFSPSVVVMIFSGLAAMLLGALLAFKSIILVGAAINLTTVILWFLAFSIGWQPNDFGYGIHLIAASILIAIVSTFIPKRRQEKKK